MRLAARLWVLGAVVPSAALLVALLAAGRFLAAQLEGTIDQALLSQAAIEAVSLFDGPDGAPHFHLQGSPLGARVHGIAPAGTLYGPDGAPVIRYPAEQPAGVTPSASSPDRPGTPRSWTPAPRRRGGGCAPSPSPWPIRAAGPTRSSSPPRWGRPTTR